MGALALAVIAILLRGSSTPEWAKADKNFPPAPAVKPNDVPPPAPVPIDCQNLASGSSYALSAETTAVSSLGGDPAAGGVTKFPADSSIVISSVRATAEGAKWYYVMAKEAGGSQIGWGWIAADWLASQDLKRR